jgi:hypothetical protein
MPKIRIEHVQNAFVIITGRAARPVRRNIALDAKHVPNFEVQRIDHVAGAAAEIHRDTVGILVVEREQDALPVGKVFHFFNTSFREKGA